MHVKLDTLKTELKTMTILPGDVLVVDFGKTVSQELLSRVQVVVEKQCPSGTKYIVLQGEACFSIMHTAKMQQQTWYDQLVADIDAKMHQDVEDRAVERVLQYLQKQEVAQKNAAWWRRFLRVFGFKVWVN
jgi:hypothetical protein